MRERERKQRNVCGNIGLHQEQMGSSSWITYRQNWFYTRASNLAENVFGTSRFVFVNYMLCSTQHDLRVEIKVFFASIFFTKKSAEDGLHCRRKSKKVFSFSLFLVRFLVRAQYETDFCAYYGIKLFSTDVIEEVLFLLNCRWIPREEK